MYYFQQKTLFQLKKQRRIQSWTDFYISTETYISGQFQAQNIAKRISFTAENNFYVVRSIFSSLSGSENGGAIFFTVTPSEIKVLVEESYFTDCSTTQNGGGIYKETNGDCVLNKVCGNSCKTQSDSGPFCYIKTDETATKHYNYVFNSHINSCEGENNGHTIILVNGATSLKYINMSHNSVSIISCFYLQTTTTTENEDSEVSFSTFERNTASNYGCFYMYANNIEANIKNINCLGNKQPSTSTTYGLFRSNRDTDMIIEDSSFIENESPNYYFYLDSGASITLKNCSIETDKMTANSPLNTDATSVSKVSFTIELELINERNCLYYIYKGRQTCLVQKKTNNVFSLSIFFIQFKK